MEFISKTFEGLSTRELYEIIKSRSQVFLLEQNIVCQDLDDVDYESRHLFLLQDDRVIAYLRAYYSDENTVQIGRVLTLAHKKGHGRTLMEKALSDIEKNMPCTRLELHAQTHAIGFYEKFGFKTVSDIFMEEGVPHVTMQK
ncbi:MAG: GNAT family N-acetyltransferase [Clostridia bacterium]|nr:GNAT family N-acetyltransferase [Clostridia bacterium]